MSSLILPRRFYSQPHGACRINPGFDRPGNTVLWLPSARKLDVARGREGTVNLEATYGVTFGADQDGIVMLPDAAHSRCIHWPVTDSAPKWTLLLRFRFVSNTAPYSGLAEYSNAVNSGTPRFLVQSRSDGNIYCHDGGGYRITDTGGAAKFAGKPETLIARWDGATLHYYRPGAHLTYTGTPSNAASNIRFGSGYTSCSDINMSLGYWAEDDLGEAACQDLLSNPWQLFRAQKRVLYFDVAGGGASLAGTASASASATAALSTAIPLTAAAAVVASASGAISTGIPLAGSAASVSSAAGVLTASITLAGSALAQALAAAGLTTGIPLAGAAAAEAQSTAALTTGAGTLSGTAAAQASAAASLTTQISLSGAAIAQALASAGLTTAPAGLAGSAAAQATATAALLTQIPLAGTAQATVTAAGGLTTIIPLTGAAASVASATGALTVEAIFSGQALAIAQAGGDLTTIIRLDGAALAQAAASGSLGTALGIPATIPHLIEALSATWEIEAHYGSWEIAA